MGVSISLTDGLRSSLLSLADIGRKINDTQARLATGKKVVSALDNPTNYFAALANRQKVSDLDGLKDGIREATQVIKAADAGMDAITRVLRQASAIADSALTSSSHAQLSQFLDQFNSMRGQVDELSADSGYGGLNLLRRQDLNINLGDNHTLVVQGADASSSGFDNMTDGLKVETADMSPLSVTQLHTVLTSAGAVKNDGALTIRNDDFQSIDGWLGSAAINIQTITSQDLAVSGSGPGGSTIASQIVDNSGVAAYGSASFTMYREAEVAVTGVSAPVSATASINNLSDITRYIDAGSAPITLTKTPSIQGVSVTQGSSRSLTAAINDPAAVSSFLDAQSSNAALSFTYHSATHLWSTSNPALSLIQAGVPPASLGLSTDGGSSSALDINLPGSWNDNDQIQINLGKWSSSDPANVKVVGYGGNGLSVSLDPSRRNDIGISLSAPENSISYNTTIDLSVAASAWKSSDAAVTLSQPSGGVIAADLNGDGSADLQFQIPGGGLALAESITASTTGAFGSTDPSVRLRYDAASGDLGLYFGGGGPGITISLSGSWAAGQTPGLGNGDTIKLTVDGRHRWVLSDNKTPNTGGIRLSMSEAKDAIDTLRLNSANNASLSSVLTVRSDFIDSMANILDTGADNLTLADMNEEGAAMLMLQTRQSLAIQSLSLSGNASRDVLRMFS